MCAERAISRVTGSREGGSTRDNSTSHLLEFDGSYFPHAVFGLRRVFSEPWNYRLFEFELGKDFGVARDEL